MGTEAHRHTFIIAECCSSWRFNAESTHLDNAYRMIVSAKEAGADAAKFQWVSDTHAMSQRRNDYEPKNYEIISYPYEWLEKLKKKCDDVGIAFMVTSFIKKDIPKIAPLVDRFKIASAESSDSDFIDAHAEYNKEVIISFGFGATAFQTDYKPTNIKRLSCVVSYPAPIEQINIARVGSALNYKSTPLVMRMFEGLSDHTTSLLTGALCVAAGGSVVEKHIRLKNTPRDNPDYGHSLDCGNIYDPDQFFDAIPSEFRRYCSAIREAELAMGNGENVMQECERVNEKRRVRA